MLYITLIIILLFLTKRYFPFYKTLINRLIIGFSIWLIIGGTLKFFFGESQKRYSDPQMAEVFVKDHPELKATWKQLDDGRIRIKPKRGKPFYLKDGVVTGGR